jgi:hypothetical protein
LTYFVFRDDTYVVSSIFACLMIVGELAAGVRILLEKGESEGSSQGPTPPGGAGQALATPPSGVATLAHVYHRPLAYMIVPENLRRKGGIRDRLCHLYGAENTEREKLSGRQKSAEEIPSRRGVIIAIVITIELDFIGIIISITIITSTFIFTITVPSRCNILG